MVSEIIRILLIEDNPGDVLLLEEMLKETGIRFITEKKDNLESGIERIKSDNFDVILLDLCLPDSQGLDSLLKLNEIRPQAPVIVLTGLKDDTAGIEAVKKGAQDYLIKGQISNNLLARTINYAIERKKLEVSLQESEEKYRTLVEAADDAIILMDINGKHLYRNKAYYTSLGYEAGNSIDPDGWAFIHPDDIEILKSKISELLIKGNLSFEYRARHRDSHWIHYLAKGTVIFDQSGKPKNVLVIIRDITDQKKTEEELRNYRDHLEKMVNERTIELEKKNAALERFNKLFVGRELRMIELKNIIADLEKQILELKNKAKEKR